MAFTDQLLVRVLQSSRGKPLSVEDVILRASLDPEEKVGVRRALKRLAKAGQVELAGKRFRIPPPPPEPAPGEAARQATGRRGRDGASPPLPKAVGAQSTMPLLPDRPRDPTREIVGTLTLNRQGYGFIRSLHGGADAFVPPHLLREAMDGDLVHARLTMARDGRTAARSLEILERRRQYAVGTYRQRSKVAWVEPREEALAIVRVPHSNLARDGEVVRVRVDSQEEGGLRGEVVSLLGRPGDPDVEVLSVAYSEGFSDVFPPDALAAANDLPEVVRDADKQGRRDMTSLPLVTIDGEDARDFDDAVYVEKTARGYRLVVAIADVTAYVPVGGALDSEAMRRATSVYFPKHVLPMLPERLSNGICSLNPGVDRLCVVADMALNNQGEPLDAEFYPGVLRSHGRCTYTQVAALMEGRDVPELEKVAPMLRHAAELASRMTAVRMKRGAIDFDLPEAFVQLDDEGQVQDITRRQRNDAHRLIEEFMLAANEAVARYFDARSLPTVYRVHGEPDPDKLDAFVALANAHGFEIDLAVPEKLDPRMLNDFLHRLEGHREQRTLNHLLLRAMMQAVYSADNIGHFGLAAPTYLHFTSPIRRYPDLVVHRLLKEHWERGGKTMPENLRLSETDRLDTVAAHCSERERAAMSASREIAAYYAASLMVRHVGKEFSGTIASVADFGLFVELDEPFVEGLIRAETLGIDWEFDSQLHRLVFPSTGLAFGVGQEVRVEVMSSNPVTRRVDFRLVSGGASVESSKGRVSPKQPKGTVVKSEGTRSRKAAGGGGAGAKSKAASSKTSAQSKPRPSSKSRTSSTSRSSPTSRSSSTSTGASKSKPRTRTRPSAPGGPRSGGRKGPSKRS